jgi:hypothetical protein
MGKVKDSSENGKKNKSLTPTIFCLGLSLLIWFIFPRLYIFSYLLAIIGYHTLWGFIISTTQYKIQLGRAIHFLSFIICASFFVLPFKLPIFLFFLSFVILIIIGGTPPWISTVYGIVGLGILIWALPNIPSLRGIIPLSSGVCIMMIIQGIYFSNRKYKYILRSIVSFLIFCLGIFLWASNKIYLVFQILLSVWGILFMFFFLIINPNDDHPADKYFNKPSLKPWGGIFLGILMCFLFLPLVFYFERIGNTLMYSVSFFLFGVFFCMPVFNLLVIYGQIIHGARNHFLN